MKATMNDKYTVISATNRLNSNTCKVAVQYSRLLLERNIEATMMTLEGWKWLSRDPEFVKIETEILAPTTKFIFVVPEYNGSIPGVLKVMFDISSYKDTWYGKKALLTGIATGRAGNLNGMEHLTSILHYLKVVVHPNKLPISSIDKMMNPDGLIDDEGTLRAIKHQLDEFTRF
ncbi:MAG: NADPH-dependent oxidoreductase [Chitinophagaceae bacterium]|nr:MAG: NADPH-dependent oxidoreductase [Chitinophagaceae bacterium]